MMGKIVLLVTHFTKVLFFVLPQESIPITPIKCV